jgi:hypothetical protein
MQKDNTTLSRKVALRISLLRHLALEPVILETHGGLGKVFERVYPDVKRGIVFETDQTKAEHLCRQRPSWSVYQAKAEASLEGGAGAHLAVNLIDCDPYGEPWPSLDAFFSSDRPRVERIGIAVNDGLRQKLRLQGGWAVHSMRQAVEKWGNAQLCERYLEVCRWKLEQIVARQDYALTHWTGYHCGNNGDMTHYAGIFTRRSRAAPRKKVRTRQRAAASSVVGPPP